MTALWVIVAVWTGYTAEAVAQGSAATDRAALEAFYDATGGASWTNSTNWKTSAPLGDWYGVTTDASGQVTRLDLRFNGLTGSIPSALGSLVNLNQLNLSFNELGGPIPTWLGNMSDLLTLYLLGNELTGGIPEELGNLNLWGLGLSGNDLNVGPIPAWLRNHTNLRWLYLSGSEVTGGIPAWLGYYQVNLERLSLGANDLTGPIPVELGRLVNLERLSLGANDLTGPIPVELGRLVNLEWLSLGANDLTGPIPVELGRLVNLEWLDLSYNWGVSGSLPSGLRQARLDRLDTLVTQACAPVSWQDWLATVEFTGRLCGTGTDVEIDVAVVYTPAAREAAGGAAALEAEIDLMVAETNQAYRASGVHHRVVLVERSAVTYVETGDSSLDLRRILDPSDGHLDEVHALRDQAGADLVHLIVGQADDICGRAYLPGVFGLTLQGCGGRTFAHELGHNMGLRHDRYQELYGSSRRLRAHPAYGYVNQRAFEAGAPRSSRWRTIMAYGTQCADVNSFFYCSAPLRFSNPRQRYAGDPMGIAYGAGGSGVDGPADAASVLNATGSAVASWRDRVRHSPTAVRALPNRRLPALGSVLEMDVSPAFTDPDGDRLTYTVSSSAPYVATALAAGARVTLTAVAAGSATIRVRAVDPVGLNVAQSFMVTVTETGTGVPFADDPIVPGVTPVKEIHITELRLRVDAVRVAAGLARFAWTDRVLSAGVTGVRLVHLLELRSALAAAYAAEGRAARSWTDAAPVAGSTLIRAVHLMELRAAVVALE